MSTQGGAGGDELLWLLGLLLHVDIWDLRWLAAASNAVERWEVVGVCPRIT